MMLFNFKDKESKDTPDQRSLTYVDPKGNVIWWYGKDAARLTFTRLWTSDLFGAKYPLEWIISTPIGSWGVEPYFDEQTMDTDTAKVKTYWEGIVRIREGDHTGKQTGTGYMELTGYTLS